MGGRLVGGLRFAFGTLTVLPVGGPPRWDRETARWGMLCAPLAGLAVGAAAAAVALALRGLGAGEALTAVAAVAVPAVLTRGLHLDGLADVADGLGSGLPPERARAVMKRSDTGAFAVITLVLVLLGQAAALGELFQQGQRPGVAAALLAGLVARAALTWACRPGMRAAVDVGLGAAVAESVPRGAALAVAGAACAAGALLGSAAGAAAVALALGAAELLLRHCRRRLGGLTGDVLGAAAETAGTVTLLVLALAA